MGIAADSSIAILTSEEVFAPGKHRIGLPPPPAPFDVWLRLHIVYPITLRFSPQCLTTLQLPHKARLQKDRPSAPLKWTDHSSTNAPSSLKILYVFLTKHSKHLSTHYALKEGWLMMLRQAQSNIGLRGQPLILEAASSTFLE